MRRGLRIGLVVLLVPVLAIGGLYVWYRFFDPNGYNHPYYQWERAQKRLDEEEAQLERALAKLEKELPPDDPRIAASLEKLGTRYLFRAHPKARPFLERALEIYEKQPPSRELVHVLQSLALLDRLERKGADPEALLRRALAIGDSVLPASDTARASLLADLAEVRFEKKDLVQAERYFREALAIAEKSDASNTDFLIVRPLEGLAWIAMARGRPEEAEPLYARALVYQRRGFGERHWQLQRPLLSLAELERKLKRPDDAERLYLEAVEFNDGYGGTEPSPDALAGLARLYRETGRSREAEAYEKKEKEARALSTGR